MCCMRHTALLQFTMKKSPLFCKAAILTLASLRRITTATPHSQRKRSQMSLAGSYGGRVCGISRLSLTCFTDTCPLCPAAKITVSGCTLCSCSFPIEIFFPRESSRLANLLISLLSFALLRFLIVVYLRFHEIMSFQRLKTSFS